TAPEPAAFSKGYRAHAPHITLDGKKLYFGWSRPVPEGFRKNSPDHRMNLYVCERSAEGWSEPKYVGPGAIVTSSRDGKLYTDDRADPYSSYIAQAILENGLLVKYVPLGGGLADLRVRFRRTSHPCISPDGRTIMFYVEKGYGPFAAFLDQSGVWSEPVNLSDHGLPASAGIATYSPDGKYIFYSDEGDIHWISSKVVERLRPDKKKTKGESAAAVIKRIITESTVQKAIKKFRKSYKHKIYR
ncbi:MAG: PD40 domain-containing protein, partial [Candidatus Aminicenantes bacterium]|nr:PD40 domain-containing protein [Candidatus Aminicenantes bacterium]